MTAPVDMKSTVNLPRTGLSDESQPAADEPKLLERWESDKLYERLREPGERPLPLHDGPPYANGNSTSDTALNKILKDFIVKSKNMAGSTPRSFPGGTATAFPSRSK